MKKRVKRKIKIKIFIPIIIIFIILVGVLSFVLISINNKNSLKVIKKNYNQYVKTTKNTTLYDKHHKKIGSISKDYELELVKIKNLSNKNKYINIKDTDLYIYYNDITKIDKITKETNNSNYITLNKNIKTNNKVDLYKNKMKVITLDKGINTSILYMDNDNYYVNYLGSLFSIKKNKSIKIVESKNSNDTNTNHISVLNYNSIENVCNNDDCIPTLIAKQELERLIKEGYYTISVDDFINYINGNLMLKDKAILIITNNINGIIKEDLNNTLNIKITVTNDKIKLNYNNTTNNTNNTLDNLNAYQVKRYTSIDEVIKMAQGENVVEGNTNLNKDVSVPVLNYHFFYDPNLGEECNESICLDVAKFREHLEYLKNNNFYTLTPKEFTGWIYGDLDIPEKSVLITVDDGAMGTGAHNGNKLNPLLDEYQLHATLFLIAGWWDMFNYEGKYLDIQSHTFDMHNYGDCGRGQLVCANYQKAKEDLQKSIDVIGDNTTFCYPFYSYDDEAIQAIKDLGFKVAFAGGSRKATRNSNKYIVPRYPILSDITMNQFINMVN